MLDSNDFVGYLNIYFHQHKLNKREKTNASGNSRGSHRHHQCVGVLTIRMEHLRYETNNWGFVWILFTELHS